MKVVLAVLLSIVVSVPALAGPPTNGTYTSTDIGGAMQPGRYSESWLGGGKLSAGNTLNEESWDGFALGVEWKWYCPYIAAAPALISDTVDGFGNGQKTWRVTYAGGYMWFNGAGPWAGGDASYTANVDMWIATVTETYANNVEVGTVRNHLSRATFVGYNDECINLAISNLEKLGDSALGVPLGFPVPLDGTTCAPAAPGAAEWGDVDSITLVIDGCETVGVEATSWGAVKALYRD
jgi:hypothetical protein